MTPDYQPIEAHLKSIPYITVTGKIRTWFGGEVVGFNAKASSIIRKPYTIQRIKEEIKSNDIPVFVDDYLGENYNSFRIMIKL